jgi:hypothetical protein
MAELYRHFDEHGALLYIGISARTVRRLAGHKKASAWFSSIAYVEVERFSTRAAARQAEIEAITRERPRHNLAHSSPHPEPNARVSRARTMKDYPLLRIEEAAQYLDLELDVLRFAVKVNIGPAGFSPGKMKRLNFQSWRTNARLLEEWEGSGGIISARVLYRRERIAKRQKEAERRERAERGLAQLRQRQLRQEQEAAAAAAAAADRRNSPKIKTVTPPQQAPSIATPKMRTRNGRSTKLNPAKVKEIRRQMQAGATKEDVARAFSVSPTTIDHITTGGGWRVDTQKVVNGRLVDLTPEELRAARSELYPDDDASTVAALVAATVVAEDNLNQVEDA